MHTAGKTATNKKVPPFTSYTVCLQELCKPGLKFAHLAHCRWWSLASRHRRPRLSMPYPSPNRTCQKQAGWLPCTPEPCSKQVSKHCLLQKTAIRMSGSRRQLAASDWARAACSRRLQQCIKVFDMRNQTACSVPMAGCSTKQAAGLPLAPNGGEAQLHLHTAQARALRAVHRLGQPLQQLHALVRHQTRNPTSERHCDLRTRLRLNDILRACLHFRV